MSFSKQGKTMSLLRTLVPENQSAGGLIRNIGGDVVLVLAFAGISFLVEHLQSSIRDHYNKLNSEQERNTFWLMLFVFLWVSASVLAGMKLDLPYLLQPLHPG